MSAPFYNAIKGTTSGTPGTGAFTPSVGASGFRAWSLVPTGWIGMVRFEDGSNWELTWSYWNGTTLSRSANQLFDSSSGSAISLTSSATAALIVQASDVMSHLGTTRFFGILASQGATGVNAVGSGTVAATGSTTAKTLSNSLLGAIPAIIATSATTANAQAGYAPTIPLAVVSTTAGVGGVEFIQRFGVNALPTGPRLFCGLTGTSFLSNTGEPSALVANVAAFAKDSTDTNIQLLTNSNAGSGTKIDTGIALAVNGFYEASIWCEPGSNKVYALLIRFDTGDIWYGSTTTDVPANGALVMGQFLGGLSSTTGTAIALQFASQTMRSAM